MELLFILGFIFCFLYIVYKLCGKSDYKKYMEWRNKHPMASKKERDAWQDEPRFVTTQEAISLLNDDERIHTFRNTSVILLGCDNDRSKILEIINDAKTIQIGGAGCRNLNHALVVEERNGSMLFVETDMEKLNKFDPI
jgi:hypothetical protein